jgi:hypothetical protein
VFWRLAYDAGLGYLLYKQSTSSLFTKWWTKITHPDATFYGILKRLISSDMESDYDYKVRSSTTLSFSSVARLPFHFTYLFIYFYFYFPIKKGHFC